MVHKYFFDSLDEFYDRAKPYSAWIDSWQGCSKNQLNERKYGWTEGIEMLEDLTGNIQSGESIQIRKEWNDYDGDIFDYERMMEGMPCLLRRRKISGKSRFGRILSLYVNLAENCSVSSEAMMWKCYAAVKAIDMLESEGYRVEVHMFDNSIRAFTNGDGMLLDIVLKKAAEPLNLSLMLNCLSSWFERGWVFGFQETLPNYDTSLGKSVPYPELKQDMNCILIDHGECLSQEKAQAFLSTLKI